MRRIHSSAHARVIAANLAKQGFGLRGETLVDRMNRYARLQQRYQEAVQRTAEIWEQIEGDVGAHDQKAAQAHELWPELQRWVQVKARVQDAMNSCRGAR